MFSWDFPIDTEGIIEDRDTSINLWMIEVVTLVLNNTPNGVYWRGSVYRLMSQWWYSVFVNTDLADWTDAMRWRETKTEINSL